MPEPPATGLPLQSTAADAPEASLSNASPPSSGLVEVRSAGAMGKGLFAVKDIRRGTRIVAETPIMAVPKDSPCRVDISAFCAELQRMPMEEKQKMDGLFYNPAHATKVHKEMIRKWYRDNKITDANGSPLKGKTLQNVSKVTLRRFAIFATNSVQMGVNGMYGAGIFALFSRINHSCVPNTHNSYNDTIKRLTVHAIRDIDAGEQITVTYIDSSCRTKEQRTDELQVWGFSCDCAACTDPAIDALRKRAFELDQRLAIYAVPWLRATAGILSSSEALRHARELIKLAQRQGLEGMELCRGYRDCANFCLEKGDMETARDYAGLELEIERRLIGTETEHMRAGMYGAEFWLAHLEEKLRARKAT